MTKTGDVYLKTDAWRIVEDGFHPHRSRVSESLFSLANEHMGVRGYFEEGYSGGSLVGSYVNGVFEEHFLKEPLSYRGISHRICFLVNTVDWLHVRIDLDGERLDLNTVRLRGFRRELDLRTGALRRELTWQTRTGKEILVAFSRLLGMERNELAVQRVELTPLNFSGEVSACFGLDFGIIHESYEQNFWECPRSEVAGGACSILGVSRNTRQAVYAGFRTHFSDVPKTALSDQKFVGLSYVFDLAEGQTRTLDRLCVVWTPRAPGAPVASAWKTGQEMLFSQGSVTYQSLLQQSAAHWARVWETSDIVIDGDPEAQQGIRYCIFQLHQTCRGALPGTNIGAKGLTGEAYNGNAFWDTEVFCLPYYLFTNPKAAKELIRFRSKTLPQALSRAKELDCQGACFPVATIDGTESCTLWQHASLQFQPTTAVAYAIRHYVSVTKDTDWLAAEGIQVLVQICRFLASRGQWSGGGRGFGYYGVMGPDEFHMMVNNNCYTNFMAARTFQYTLAVCEELERQDPGRWGELSATLSLTSEEKAQWRSMTDAMIMPSDATGIFEQHDGFFDLPHTDIHAIPPEQFPLYHSWAYDRIYRSNMIKQPDVLMFLFLYSQSFTRQQKLANYRYYEPKCIHESSLSPSVHSILAAEIGLRDDAFDLFRFATRIDLDDYNRNTAEGLHLTSIAGAWMNIVYGFGGMRSDGGDLCFSPTIPDAWTSFRFRVLYRGSLIEVEVTRTQSTFRLVSGPPVRVSIRGTPELVTEKGLVRT